MEKHQTNMRAFFRMLSGNDHVVGRYVDQLEKHGRSRTDWQVDALRRVLGLPLIIYDSHQPTNRSGKVRSKLALIADLASTMIKFGGETPPSAHTGRSLVQLIQGQTLPDWRTDFLAVPPTIPRWEGVRDAVWVFARYFADGPNRPPFEFLYDLESDPDQLVNVVTLTAEQKTE